MIRSKSYMAIPPGETIREQLEDRGLTQKDLARLTGLSEKHISKLVNGKVILTPETAALLEKAIEVPAKFWLALEAGYRADLLKVEHENAEVGNAPLLAWIQGEFTARMLSDNAFRSKVLAVCKKSFATV